MPDRIIDIPRVGQVAFPDTMSDDDIAAAADELYQQAPPGRDEPWAYLGATLKNLPGSVMREGKKMVEGVASLASDIGTMVPGTIQPEGAREAAGGRLLDTVKNFIPGVIQTYGNYLDPKYRETVVRDEPAKMIGDMAGLVGGVKAITSKPVRTAAAATTKRVLENPVAGAVVGGMAGSTLGPAGTAIGALEGASRGPAVFRRLRRMLESSAPKPEGQLVRSTVDDAVRSSVDDLAKEGGQFYTYADDVQDIQGAGGEYTLPPFVRGAQPETIPTRARGGRLVVPAPTVTEDISGQLARELRTQPDVVELPLSHPTGGEYTLPPPTNPAAGGQLRLGTPAPTGSVEAQLVEALRGLPGRTAATPGVRLSPRAQAAAASVDDAALAAEDTARRMAQAQRMPGRLTDMAADEAAAFQARQAHGIAGFQRLPQGMPSSPIPSIPRDGAAPLKDFVEYWAQQLRQRKPSITDAELQRALEAMMKRSSRQ